MDFLEYDIKDSGAFAPFISTMEGTGADIDGSKVMFESDNSAAKMLADTLVEYEIMIPAMESRKKAEPAAGGETPAAAETKSATATTETKPAVATKKVVAKKGTVAKPAAKKPVAKKAPATKAAPAPATKAAPAATEKAAAPATEVKVEKKEGAPAAEAEKAAAPAAEVKAEKKEGAPAVEEKSEVKAAVPGAEKAASDAEAASVVVGEDAPKAADPDAGKKTAPTEDPYKKEVYKNIIEKVDSLGLDEGMAKAVEKKVTAFIDAKAEKAGDKSSEFYTKLAEDPMTLSKLVFTVIQRADPELYEELKKSGKLNDKSKDTASLTQKTELAKAISQIVGQIEVPDAFNVEIDDSEWDNALIKAFGFPMINLTSPLVREMLRAQEPKAQKRAYKEFKKQLKSDPDVAKALGIGLMGTLGLGGSSGDAKTDTKTKIDTRTEGVNADGKVLVEGPITDIANALKSPVDVLKSIAQNKGTPCRRNNLVVMYDEIEGKSGDSSETVKVTPLGASGGTLVDLNLSVPVPMNHLTAFYSVVDPKASFKSYAKAMAEVNKKSDNAKLGLGGAAAAAGKQLLSKIPLLGRGAKKDLEAKEADGNAKALGELAMYVKENGHPPFYLLKPKSDPKEIDRWSDEDAANGYQMITMMVEGHKAGMILKVKTAEALFKVG